MNDRKAETMTISGKEYAKVVTRLKLMHEDHDKCEVETTVEFKDNFALFTAKLTTNKGTFSGHSLGKTTEKKAFEKLETIALGRALSFAGYLASGEIASYEEMADIANAVTSTQLNSLILKYSKEYTAALEGLDRVDKAKRFNKWCRDVTGEEVDFRNHASWEAEWMKTCWAELTGVDEDVPFE